MEALNSLTPRRGEVGILWLGQNSYVLKTSNGTTVAIDPYLSRDKRIRHIRQEPPVKSEDFKVDYVFCTHDHWDHTDPIALPIIAEKFPDTVILGPQESCDRLKELGVEKVQLKPLKAKAVYRFQSFTVTPHYSVPTEEADTTHFGYVFEFEGTKIYNMGDTYQSVVDDP
jgi:L-ascorbate 6-phosphate lactonase